MIRNLIIGLAALQLSGAKAAADICDLRLSTFISDAGSSTVAATGASTAAIGATGKLAGLYTLSHSASGLTMLGSTMTGSSAAGTVGIIGGTSGAIGSTAAILMAPISIGIGVAVATGVGGTEAVCYILDDRVTEYSDVLSVMTLLDDQDTDDRFVLITPTNSDSEDAEIVVTTAVDNSKRYRVANLYIVNEILMHRDWFKNTNLGPLYLLAAE